MLGWVKGFAAGFGIRDLRSPQRLASTRRALAVAEHARDAGRLERFRAAAFDAYWREGVTSTWRRDLAHAARAAGLDPRRSRRLRTWARSRGWTRPGVRPAKRASPAYPRSTSRAGGGARPAARVVGCQPYEVLADAARRAGARRRAEP